MIVKRVLPNSLKCIYVGILEIEALDFVKIANHGKVCKVPD